MPSTPPGSRIVVDRLLSSVPPYTSGAKEYGLHAAADAAPDNASRGLTGGQIMLNGGTIQTISIRQHLATSDMHGLEVHAAATILHKLIPIRGILSEFRVIQEEPTPLYIDSASTVCVAERCGAVKKSAWIRRKAEVLTDAKDSNDIRVIKTSDHDNYSDPQTKDLVYAKWIRHLHYTQNRPGDPPSAKKDHKKE